MKYKKYIVIFITIIILVMLILGRNIIGNIQKRNLKKEKNEELFSYVVYDNQNEHSIKILITLNSEKGIEYIECPNGNKIYGNSKTKILLDYSVKSDENYIFKVKEKELNEIQKEINVNNVSIGDTTLKLNIDEDFDGYETLSINNKIELENYKTYYKIGKSENWIEGTSFSIVDYDVKQNNYINDDGTLTISVKTENTTTNNIVKLEDTIIPVNTTQNEDIKSINSESLLKAVEENDLNTGKYKINILDEVYSAKVYNFDGNLDIGADTRFGIEQDVANSSAYAQNMVILKVNGNLTIKEGAKLSSYASKDGYGGTKGMLVYCTGTITNNGEISMTARGAYAEGQNVYLWKNIDGNYEYVPKIGAIGAESVATWYTEGKKGENGINRQTGGGGSGATCYGYKSGKGSTGTSYSGGSGGRRNRRWKCRRRKRKWWTRWRRKCS